MKIALYGASGTLGRRIAQEALLRGHELTAIVRDPARVDLHNERLTVIPGDARDAAIVVRLVRGHDAVVSAVGPGHDEPPTVLVDTARSLLAGTEQAEVRRLLAVGGAGSLETAPGLRLMDSPRFPPDWKPVAQAHADALAIYRAYAGDVDWTYLSPANLIAPGERTGHYRTGTEQLVRDDQGKSFISAEDFAIAVADELEQPQYVRQRFTVAY